MDLEVALLDPDLEVDDQPLQVDRQLVKSVVRHPSMIILYYHLCVSLGVCAKKIQKINTKNKPFVYFLYLLQVFILVNVVYAGAIR